MLLVRIAYATRLLNLHPLMKTRWMHGLSTMLDCWMSSLSGQVMSSPRSLQLHPPSVSVTLIYKAPSKMKCDKGAGPSGIIAELLKAVGEQDIELARQLAESIFSSCDILSDWEESFRICHMPLLTYRNTAYNVLLAISFKPCFTKHVAGNYE